MAHGREDTCSRTATGRNQQVLDRRAQASPVVVLASLEATRYCDNWRGASGREQSPSRRPPRGARTPPPPFSPTSCAHRASLTANGRERTRSIRSERASSRPTIACTRRRSRARTLPASSRPATRTRRPSRAPPAGARRVPPARRRQAEQKQRHRAASHHAARAYETFTRLHASPSSAHLAALRTSPSDSPASIESGRELGVRADDRHSSEASVCGTPRQTLA